MCCFAGAAGGLASSFTFCSSSVTRLLKGLMLFVTSRVDGFHPLFLGVLNFRNPTFGGPTTTCRCVQHRVDDHAGTRTKHPDVLGDGGAFLGGAYAVILGHARGVLRHVVHTRWTRAQLHCWHASLHLQSMRCLH